MQDNAMKTKFAAGQPAFGLSVMIPSPQIVESAAGMGFDWVLIDCEHGTVGLEPPLDGRGARFVVRIPAHRIGSGPDPEQPVQLARR